MTRNPEFWPATPEISSELSVELRSEFWSRDRELKESDVSGFESENSTFRLLCQSWLHIRIPHARNLPPHISWYAWIVGPGRSRFGLVNRPKSTNEY